MRLVPESSEPDGELRAASPSFRMIKNKDAMTPGRTPSAAPEAADTSAWASTLY